MRGNGDSNARWKLKIGNTGIYKEDVQNFKASYHESTYRMAFTMLEHIIHENFENSDMKEYNNPANILSFIGGRGSGKTSVMMSMAKALQEYDGYRKMPFGAFNKDDSLRFTCLDCIDASLLEKGEDIFNVVLAQIFEKYIAMESRVDGMGHRSESYDFHKREGLKKIETIYRIVREIEAMNDKKGSNVTSSYLSDLDSLSSSQRVKKEFQELINIFIGVLEAKNRNSVGYGPKYYLVIPIDDIDLNVEYGFTMLEKINRYLMVKNVIILLTLDYNQMKKLTTEHFYKMYERSTRNILNDEAKSHVEKISIEYLEKILPVNYRVYMARINDRYSANQIEVDDESLGIKKAFLTKIYQRTGVCFDSQGEKQHFYYPDTLRQTNNFFQLLKSTHNVDFLKISEETSTVNGNEKLVKLEENIDLLMQDLIYRLSVNKLSQIPEAKELFDNIVTIDMHRAKGQVVSFYHSKVLGIETEDFDNVSYGRLVETLYKLGREQNNKYKPLVHCLLAYFSYALTREYPFIQSKTLVEKDLKNLKKFIGNNVLKEWAGNLLPIIEITKDALMNTEDSASNTYDSKKTASLSQKTVSFLQAFGVKFQMADMDDYVKLAETICGMEVLYCLISNIKNEYYNEDITPKICFGAERIKTGEYKLDFILAEDSKKVKSKENAEMSEEIYGKISIHTRGDFDILNFIPNSLKETQELKEFEEKVIIGVANVYRMCKGSEIDLSVINQQMEKYSLVPKYETWEKRYGKNALPIPLQWLDFSYNVLKRIWKYTKNEFPKCVFRSNMGELYTYTGKVYQHMGELLDDQIKFYGISDSKRTKANFKEQFLSHPVVEYFMAKDLEEIYQDKEEKKNAKSKRKEFWKSFFERIRNDLEK